MGKKVQYQNITISSEDYNIYKTRHRFKIGEEVSAYYPENLKEAQHQIKYEIYRGKVIAVNANKLSYVLKYNEQGTTRLDISEKYIYKVPKTLFKIGEDVMACWPRNAQNKNCPHRYKRFPAEVIGINNDTTYKLRYKVSPYLLSLYRPTTFPEDYQESEDNKKQSAYAPTSDQCYAENVREMWIQYPPQFVIDEMNAIKKELGTPFYMSYSAEMVESWSCNKVIEWAKDIGFGQKKYLIESLRSNEITGKMLLEVEAENDKDLRKELLNKLFAKNKKDKDEDKTESVELDDENDDGLDLNRIELRNLLSNIKHLKQQHELMQAQYNDQGGGHKDYAKLQQVWQNFRKEMGRTGGTDQGAPDYQDTDTK